MERDLRFQEPGGVNGARPTHPELLDYLANTFIADGWRLKALHRRIVLSSTYRQVATVANPAADPENQWLGRFARRRLDAEEIRDAMLTISGRLNYKAGGPSVIPPVADDLVQLLYDPKQWEVTADPAELAQSLHRLRNQVADHYRLASAELAERQQALERLRSRVAAQHERLSAERQQVIEWAARRQQELDSRVGSVL